MVNWKGSSSFDRWRQMFIVGQIVGSKSSRGILNNNPAILFNDPSSARVRDNDGERRERKRNRFYGDRNYAPGWNLVRWNAKRLLQLLSPPSVYFRAFCLHWRKFFDERRRRSDFHFPAGLVKFAWKMENRVEIWWDGFLRRARNDRGIRSKAPSTYLSFPVCTFSLWYLLQEAVKYTNIARHS